jgi:hypothetical protein
MQLEAAATPNQPCTGTHASNRENPTLLQVKQHTLLQQYAQHAVLTGSIICAPPGGCSAGWLVAVKTACKCTCRAKASAVRELPSDTGAQCLINAARSCSDAGCTSKQAKNYNPLLRLLSSLRPCTQSTTTHLSCKHAHRAMLCAVRNAINRHTGNALRKHQLHCIAPRRAPAALQAQTAHKTMCGQHLNNQTNCAKHEIPLQRYGCS